MFRNRIKFGWTIGLLIVLCSVACRAAIITQRMDIVTDTCWTSNNTYIIQGDVSVINAAELTIDPGTVIRFSTTGNTPGVLIVTRGSKIHATGTATKPIVFTDTSDDNFGTNFWGQSQYNNPTADLTAQWAGLYILGSAYVQPYYPYTNPCCEATRTLAELICATDNTYGGCDDDDDSGELQYISLRYCGHEMNEIMCTRYNINGLNLAGVGRETRIDHVEVFNGRGGGMEFRGGTVNTKYLSVWNCQYDSFSMNTGYRGKGQFWLAVQGANPSNGSISWRGMDFDQGYLLATMPTIYNVTMIGLQQEVGRKKNTAVHFHNGAGGRLFNGLFMDFGGACGLIEGALGGAYDSANNFTSVYAITAYYTHETDGTRKGDVLNSSFWKFGTNVFFSCEANTQNLAAVWGADYSATGCGMPNNSGNKAHYGLPLFALEYEWMCNKYLTSSSCPVKEIYRDETPDNVAYVDYYPVLYLDPTLNTAAYLDHMINGRFPPRGDAFFTPVNFRGAFANTNVWLDDWALTWRIGNTYSFDWPPNYNDYTGLFPDLYVGTNGLGVIDGAIEVSPMQPVNVLAHLHADVYKGERADYFIVCHAPGNTWYWYSVPNQIWRSGWYCSWQNGMIDDYPEVSIFNASFPFPGQYTFYYILEFEGNGQWDPYAPYYYDTITVNVDW